MVFVTVNSSSTMSNYMKKTLFILLPLIILCLSSACGSMRSEQSNGIGSVAGSSAGSQATPKKGPGSLGSFLYHQQRELQTNPSSAN